MSYAQSNRNKRVQRPENITRKEALMQPQTAICPICFETKNSTNISDG